MKRRAFIATTGAGIMALPFIPHFSLEPGLQAGPVSPEERRRRAFPNVVLLTHEDKEVRFYDDLVKDKTVLLHFMYIGCRDGYCGLSVANLARVEKEFKGRVGRDVFFYSITLDPEHDTPAALKKYARQFTRNPGWLFLTGKLDSVETLRRGLGYVQRDPILDRDRAQHVGMLRIGIEPLERWATAPVLGRPRTIASYLRWMEPNGERPTPWMLVGKNGRSRTTA